MNITCPQCQFARTVPDDRLPGPTAIATCPQCGCRFRVFRDEEATEAIPAPAAPPSPVAPSVAEAPAPQHAPVDVVDAAPAQDDPLPPGAIIPGQYPPSEPETPPPSAPVEKTEASSRIENDAEYRQAAVQAYQRQNEQGRAEEEPLDNPWLYPERDGYLAAFYQTAMRVMFAAPRFFAGLKADTPQARALFFYLLVSVCQILVERIWSDVLSSALTSGGSADPQLQKLIQMLTPQTDILMALLLRTAIVTLELFVASALYFLVFKLLVPKKANYQLIFQVLAYSAAPALLCVVPVAGSIVGFIWGVACSFVGCRHAMGLTWTQTVLGLAPVYALGMPFILHLLQSTQALGG